MAMKKKKTTNRKKKSLSRSRPKAGRAKSNKRKVIKKARKTQAAKTPKVKGPKVIGVVTHYFPHVSAAVVKLKRPIALNDAIAIKGHSTDIRQSVESMQIDHKPIQKAAKGKEIGLQVKDRAREGDLVLEDKPIS